MSPVAEQTSLWRDLLKAGGKNPTNWASVGSGVASAIPMVTGMAGLGEVAPAAQGALSGAATGASLGTAIAPGVGTAIGAGLGAIGGGVSEGLGKGGGKPAKPTSALPAPSVRSVQSTPSGTPLPSGGVQQIGRKNYAMDILTKQYI